MKAGVTTERGLAYDMDQRRVEVPVLFLVMLPALRRWTWNLMRRFSRHVDPSCKQRANRVSLREELEVKPITYPPVGLSGFNA